jgi:hypothetical protein
MPTTEKVIPLNAADKSTPPSTPGEWSLAQIQEALKRPLPRSLLATRKQGGQVLEYIPWYTAARILDKYAPGWTWNIHSIHTTGDRLFLTGRLTIPTAEGTVYREATGTEELKEINPKTGEIRELVYGDPSSNSESMAFRRAAAKFGLGLYLYDKD